jgi:hypothetical protein
MINIYHEISAGYAPTAYDCQYINRDQRDAMSRFQWMMNHVISRFACSLMKLE